MSIYVKFTYPIFIRLNMPRTRINTGFTGTLDALSRPVVRGGLIDIIKLWSDAPGNLRGLINKGFLNYDFSAKPSLYAILRHFYVRIGILTILSLTAVF